jgi:predicted HD phosphohydrolase
MTTPVNHDSFSEMSESTQDQWNIIIKETIKNQPRVADSVIRMLLSLKDIVDGFSVDQLTHSLQTATRAERAGADKETVVASLCHDIGKAVSVINHPEIAAGILKPYVRNEVYNVILTHQDFQGQHYYNYLGLDPNMRKQYKSESWYEFAETFADEWDQKSFDPNYESFDLMHFKDILKQVFSKPQY